MKLFAYCRVSTLDQAEKNSIENQKIAIKRFSKDSYEIKEWFIDNGVSATAEIRPAFDAMILRLEEAEGIICHRMDRLGRDVMDLVGLLDMLREQEKAILFVEGGSDTTNATGRLYFQLRASFAEYERGLLRERILEGIARAQAEGIHCGRPRKTIPKQKLENYLEIGLSLSSIGKIYKMHPKTVKRIAKEQELI